MYLLFDIGKSKIRLAYSLDKNSLSEPSVYQTPKQLSDIFNLISEYATKLPNISLKAASGGVAGIFNFDKSILLKSPQRPEWKNIHLKDHLQEILKVPVYLENDAAIVGLGEAVTGPGLNHQLVAYLTISTGVGGVRIINGKIDRSAFGFEVGHQIIDPNGPVCPGCGVNGDLESFISGAALEKKYQKKIAEIDEVEVWYGCAKYLALGIHNTILFWSPEVIIIGGGMMKKIPLDVTINQLKQIHKIYDKLPEIYLAKLDDYGGLYGALEFLKQNFN